MKTYPGPIYPEPILWQALNHRRPDGSQAIRNLMSEIAYLAPDHAVIECDDENNLWIDTRRNGETTMFQAHLDTVHHDTGRVYPVISPSGLIHTRGADVLGADDGAGCALVASLMSGGIPALYLWTQGEEIGGIGGSHAAHYEWRRVDKIERCIAFDRRDTKDICGAQCVGNLASREFVSDLAGRLAMGHQWATGTYTDNSEWQDVIPEIVNVSVGYYREHSHKERLDYKYFCELRKRCLTLNWETLPTLGPEVSAKCHREDYWPPYWPEYGGPDEFRRRDDLELKPHSCECCGADDQILVETEIDGFTMFACPWCLQEFSEAN